MEDFTERLDKAIQVIKIAVAAEERGQLAEEFEQVLTSHGVVNVLRSDDARLVEKADLQKAAPDFEDGFYQVPPIIE